MVWMPRADVVGVEERLFDQLSDVRIIGGVELAGALAPNPHQVAPPQFGQVLGDGGRLGPHV